MWLNYNLKMQCAAMLSIPTTPWTQALRSVRTALQAATAPPVRACSPAQRGTTASGAAWRASCPAPLAPTAPSQVWARWSSVCCVLQVSLLTHTHVTFYCPLTEGEGGFGVFDSLSTWYSLFLCPCNSEVSELQHNKTGRDTRQEQNM